MEVVGDRGFTVYIYVMAERGGPIGRVGVLHSDLACGRFRVQFPIE